MWRALRSAWFLPALLCGAAHAAPPLLIDGARIVDAFHDGEPASVLVVEGSIREVAAPGGLRAPDGARVVDGRGWFLTPGLTDLLVDLDRDGGPAGGPAPDQGARERALRRYLRSGVTSIGDRGGQPAPAAASLAPRRAALGAALLVGRREALQPELLRRLAAGRIAAGAQQLLIEVHEEGPRSAAAVAAAIAEARRAGIRVAVRGASYATSRAALAAGADAIVGGVLDRPIDAEWLAALAARGAWYVPTLAAVDGAERIASGRLRLTPAEWVWADLAPLDRLLDAAPPAGGRAPGGLGVALANLRRVLEAGGSVALGSDAGAPGVPHGPALHRELELAVAAGATPRQALAAATGGSLAPGGAPAGRIAAGAAADLLLLDHDPRATVRNLGQIVAVVSAGAWLEPAAVLPERPADVLARFDLAFDVHDPDVIAACFAEDATLQLGRTVLRGREALRAHFSRGFASRPGLRRDVLDELVEGDSVVQTVQERGPGPARRWQQSFEVRDGFVVRAWIAPAR
jgi:imidazolonepropionase-like amidohydrolase